MDSFYIPTSVHLLTILLEGNGNEKSEVSFKSKNDIKVLPLKNLTPPRLCVFFRRKFYTSLSLSMKEGSLTAVLTERPVSSGGLLLMETLSQHCVETNTFTFHNYNLCVKERPPPAVVFEKPVSSV